MKNELTFKDDKSNKFWTIETKGKSFTVTFGKTGTNGQSQTKEFESKEHCEKEAEKLAAEKMKKGYKVKGASSKTTAADGKKIQKSSKKVSVNAAGADGLSELGKKLGVEIPDSVRSLYAKNKPEKEGDGGLGFRLMSIEESIDEDFEAVLFEERTKMLDRLGFRLWPFWTNDNSDYIAVFMNGPLIGYTCFVNHDDLALNLACGDIETQMKRIKAVRRADPDEPDYPQEFWGRTKSTPEALKRDADTIKKVVKFAKENKMDPDDDPYIADYIRTLYLPKEKNKMRKTLKDAGLGQYAVLEGEELIMALAQGDINEVEMALDAGMDVDEVIPVYGTVLSSAAYYMQPEIVRLAISKGADANNPENPPLVSVMAKDKNIKMFELLFENVAVADGSAGRTALENAMGGGISVPAKKVEALLRSHGARTRKKHMNSKIQTVLYMASKDEINKIKSDPSSILRMNKSEDEKFSTYYRDSINYFLTWVSYPEAYLVSYARGYEENMLRGIFYGFDTVRTMDLEHGEIGIVDPKQVKEIAAAFGGVKMSLLKERIKPDFMSDPDWYKTNQLSEWEILLKGKEAPGKILIPEIQALTAFYNEAARRGAGVVSFENK